MNTKKGPRHVRGSRPVVAMLPSGRLVWLHLRPEPASIRGLDRLADSVERECRNRSYMLSSKAAAIRRLSRRLQHNTNELRRSWMGRERKLRDEISSGDAKLHERVGGKLEPAFRHVMANRKRQQAQIVRHQHRELWNQLVLMSSGLLMAAYGSRGGNPLSENNLVIGLSLGVWLFGDELADRLSGKGAGKSDSVKGLDVWSYTAPFANVLTGWWLLSGRQHERFITGITDFKDLRLLERKNDADRRKHPYYVYATEDLSLRIAPDHVGEFQRFQNVPVAATIQTVEFADGSVDASHVSLDYVAILEHHLVIFVRIASIPPEVKKLQVAWIVDTQEPEAGP